MTGTDEELNELVEKVLELAPDANAEAVKKEFERYRDEFLIPPKDAMRSVLRKFEVAEEEAAVRRLEHQRVQRGLVGAAVTLDVEGLHLLDEQRDLGVAVADLGDAPTLRPARPHIRHRISRPRRCARRRSGSTDR